jgi:L-lysine 2,3-aminomutase
MIRIATRMTVFPVMRFSSKLCSLQLAREGTFYVVAHLGAGLKS